MHAHVYSNTRHLSTKFARAKVQKFTDSVMKVLSNHIVPPLSFSLIILIQDPNDFLASLSSFMLSKLEKSI